MSLSRSSAVVILAASTFFSSLVHAQSNPELMDVGWFGDTDVLAKMQTCSASVRAAQLERWRAASNTGNVTTFLDSRNNRFIAVTGDVWTCLSLSPNGFVEFPLSALKRVVELQGISSDAALNFYKNLQQDLANTGFAKAMIPQNGTSRLLVYLTVDAGATTQVNVRYTTVELTKIKESDFTNLVSERPSSVRTRTMGADGLSDILKGILSPRPLRGNFLRGQGNSKTGAMEFAGTTWQSVQSPADQVTFEPGGIAVYRHRKTSSMGTWVKEDNVMYFSNKLLFSTGTLTNISSTGIFEADTRRAAFTPRAMPGSTSQPTEFPEFRGHVGYVQTADTTGIAQLKDVWNKRALATRQNLEAQRQTRLNETETEAWATLQPKSIQWSLCSDSLFNEVTLLAELDDAKEPELCRAFIGTRKVWQAVLAEGCNGRCTSFHLPAKE